ncbi:hypothetical protein DUGA2_57040 [Duganella sp. HH101]|nr:hypothetical protein DUGA2_57040 [Duganella sp. HH101]
MFRLLPVALVVLPASSSVVPLDFRMIWPLAPRTALLALMPPRWLTSAPYTPTRPPCATICPRFSAMSAGADTTTCTFGSFESNSCTLCPAASTTSPFGDEITPLFSTAGATRKIWPPDGVVIAPALLTLPAVAAPLKLFLPARKSAFDIARLDATRPLTSTREPAPNSTPFGLIRNTLPFDCSEPRMRVGS